MHTGTYKNPVAPGSRVCAAAIPCPSGLPRHLDRAPPPHALADDPDQHDDLRVHQGEAMGGQLYPWQAVLHALPHELLQVLLPSGEPTRKDGQRLRTCAKSGPRRGLGPCWLPFCIKET